MNPFTEDQKTLGTVNGKVVVAPIYLEGTEFFIAWRCLKAGWKRFRNRDELKKLCEDLTAAIQPFNTNGGDKSEPV